MAENPATSWPKTKDGTTDWEAVFEAETTGLVTVISQANTVDALNECASVVIGSLFTRKNDRPEVARYTALLNAAIDEGSRTGDIDVTRQKVIRVLRQIKRARVIKARRYVEQKRRKQAIDRRGKGKSAFSGGRLAAAGIAAAVILIAGAAGLYGLGQALAPAAETAAVAESATQTVEDPEEQPAAPAEAAAPAPPEPVEEAKPPEPQPEFPQAVLLKPFYWAYQPEQGARRYISYQPFIEVPDRDRYSKICVNVPWVTDAIYLDLSRGHPKARRATDAELGRISSRAARKINNRYGAGTVGSILLVPNTDKRFQHAVRRCELERTKERRARSNNRLKPR